MIRQLQLRRELQLGGAHGGDARTLAALTQYLPAGVPALSRRTKREIAEQLGLERPRVSWVKGLEFGSAFAICLAVVLLSQMALPGSPLYAIKRVSEEARLKVQPSFMYEVVDRRRMELTDLEQRKASSGTIKQAQADLQVSVVAAEKMERASGITQPNLHIDLNTDTNTSGQTSGDSGTSGSDSTPGGSSSTSGGSTTGSSGTNTSGGTPGGSGSTTTQTSGDLNINGDTKPDDH